MGREVLEWQAVQAHLEHKSKGRVVGEWLESVRVGKAWQAVQKIPNLSKVIKSPRKGLVCFCSILFYLHCGDVTGPVFLKYY